MICSDSVLTRITGLVCKPVPPPQAVLTDKLLSVPLSVIQLHLPLNSPLAGSELTKEPFRWDQRLFALVLRLPGAATPDNEQLGSVPTDESAITQMCEVTGGLACSYRCHAAVSSPSTLMERLDFHAFCHPFLSGRSYCVRTQRMLNQCLESLVQKVQSGVVINFEKTGPDPPLTGEGECGDDA